MIKRQYTSALEYHDFSFAMIIGFAPVSFWSYWTFNLFYIHYIKTNVKSLLKIFFNYGVQHNTNLENLRIFTNYLGDYHQDKTDMKLEYMKM